jgi:uncharacterized membrane protein
VKLSDIDDIHKAGLITENQRDAIVTHFELDRGSNKLLAILSIIGAVLVSAGIILLIASNWDDIPRFVKLAGGLALLGGAHAGGWFLGRAGRHPRVAEALHLIGSVMFLANIALVGQIYHLSSRTPNAILLWLVGIAPLAWILRSKAQHILTLCVLLLWLGLELNEPDSLLYFGGEARQFMSYVIIGVALSGLGMLLQRSRFPEFGPPTEGFGILMLLVATYPLAIGPFYGFNEVTRSALIVCAIGTALAAILLVVSALKTRLIPDRQSGVPAARFLRGGEWRWTWAIAQAGVLGLAWFGLVMKYEGSQYAWKQQWTGPHWFAAPALFLFCLLQAQVGLLRRAPWLVNVAVAFIGLHIITAYFQLFGSMENTGLMFVTTGALLIGLAIYLERKRRSILKRMSGPPQPDPIV